MKKVVKKLPKSTMDRLTALMEETAASQTLERAIEVETLARQHGKATEKYIRLFKEFICDPAHGQVTVKGERYVFFKGETMSTAFFSVMARMCPGEDRDLVLDFGTNFLYDMGRCLGKSDQRHFLKMKRAEKNGGTNEGTPVRRSSTGSVSTSEKKDGKKGKEEPRHLKRILALPTVMGSMGWGSMEIELITSNFVPNSTFLLKFRMEHSLEAAVRERRAERRERERERERETERERERDSDRGKERGGGGERDAEGSGGESPSGGGLADEPVCLMCAGYAEGYLNECVESVELAAVEVACRACGHSDCEFLVAPVDLIFAHVAWYLEQRKREDFEKQMRLLQMIKKRYTEGKGWLVTKLAL